jgi:hypothetical protein
MKRILTAVLFICFCMNVKADVVLQSSVKTGVPVVLSTPVVNQNSIYLIGRSIDTNKPIFLYEHTQTKPILTPLKLEGKITQIQRNILASENEIFFLAKKEETQTWWLERINTKTKVVGKPIDLGDSFYAESLAFSKTNEILIGGQKSSNPSIRSFNLTTQKFTERYLEKSKQGIIRKIFQTTGGYITLVGSPYGLAALHNIYLIHHNKDFVIKKVIERQANNHLSDLSFVDSDGVYFSYATAVTSKTNLILEKFSNDLSKLDWKREIESPPLGLYHYEILPWKNGLWIIGSVKMLGALYLDNFGNSKAVELDKGSGKNATFAVPSSGYSSIINQDSLRIFFPSTTLDGVGEITAMEILLKDWSPSQASFSH